MITTTLRSLERTISLAFAGTFFSGDMTFGRVMAASLLILHTRYSLIGCAGALLTEWVSHSLTKNKSLLGSGIIPLNGLFMGLAVAAFFPDALTAAACVAALSVVTSLATIISQRVLKTWDLPVLVLPYCLAFWFLQFIASQSAVLKLTIDQAAVISPDHPAAKLLSGSLAGFGQIFFAGNLWASGAVALVLLAFHRRSWSGILLAAVLPAAIARMCLGSHWGIDSGLMSFGGVLLFQAASSGAVSLPRGTLWILIGLSGLVEAMSLKLASTQGLFALSGSYILIAWTAKLCEEVKHARQDSKSSLMNW